MLCLQHVAHQRAITEELERDGHWEAAIAREVLSTLEKSLQLAGNALRARREAAGLKS